MSQKHKPFVPEKRPQCCGKNAYPSRHEAEMVGEEQKLFFRGLLLDVYRCQCGCGQWHLTRRDPGSSIEIT